jgi:hypothetical protein
MFSCTFEVVVFRSHVKKHKMKSLASRRDKLRQYADLGKYQPCIEDCLSCEEVPYQMPNYKIMPQISNLMEYREMRRLLYDSQFKPNRLPSHKNL